jgi:hypothetical protein
MFWLSVHERLGSVSPLSTFVKISTGESYKVSTDNVEQLWKENACGVSRMDREVFKQLFDVIS